MNLFGQKEESSFKMVTLSRKQKNGKIHTIVIVEDILNTG